jgi:hypothetical protein
MSRPTAGYRPSGPSRSRFGLSTLVLQPRPTSGCLVLHHRTATPARSVADNSRRPRSRVRLSTDLWAGSPAGLADPGPRPNASCTGRAAEQRQRRRGRVGHYLAVAAQSVGPPRPGMPRATRGLEWTRSRWQERGGSATALPCFSGQEWLTRLVGEYGRRPSARQLDTGSAAVRQPPGGRARAAGRSRQW